MARTSIAPDTTAASEADLLDQRTPAAPEPVMVAENLTGPADALDANEADLVEQASALPGDEAEDYPNTAQNRSWEAWPDA